MKHLKTYESEEWEVHKKKVISKQEYQIDDYVLVNRDGIYYACQIIDIDVDAVQIYGNSGTHSDEWVEYLMIGYKVNHPIKLIGLNIQDKNKIERKLNTDEIEKFELLKQSTKYNL